MKSTRVWLLALVIIALSSQSLPVLAAPLQPTISEQAVPTDASTGETGDFPPLLNPLPYTGPLYFTAPEEDVQAAATDAPSINLYYGDSQNFGAYEVGTEQINLIGSVSSALPVTSLSYKLNGGAATPLSLGGQPDVGITDPDPPANPRLVDDWDFNIEIPTTELNDDSNQVVITAVDANGSTDKTVTVNYQTGNDWPLPYTADWSELGDLLSTVRVIDGEWEIVNGTLQPQQIGYDRLVGLGDIDWTNYEVQVPITVHAIDESGFPAPSGGPGLGVIVRWQGHLDDPNYTGDEQPMRGWRRLGALAWYRWGKNNGDIVGAYNFIGGTGQQLGDDVSTKQMNFNTTYIFKIRVETVSDYQACDPGDSGNPRRSCYHFKIWEQGTAEPAAWDMVGLGNFGDPESGSIVLVAHHVEATFGDVTVTNVEPITDSFNACTIDDALWLQSLPSGASVASVAATGYTAEILAKAGMSNSTGGGNKVDQVPHISQSSNDIDVNMEVRFTSSVDSNGDQQGFLFEEDDDDFVRVAVLRDNGTVKVQGHSFSGGVATQEFNTNANVNATPSYLRVSRIDDTFTVDYSFDGFSYTNAGSFTHALAVSQLSLFSGSSGSGDHTTVVDYLRNLDSTADPSDTVALTFDRITVNRDPAEGGTVAGGPASPTPGNETCGSPLQLTASPAPGWSLDRWEGGFGSSSAQVLQREFGFGEQVTAYFVRATYTLTTDVQSNGVGTGGTVSRNPNKSRYDFEEDVDVTASADPGWAFSGWSGDLNSATPTETITMDGNKSVTAIFEQEKYSLDVTIADADGGDASENSVAVTTPSINPPGYVYGEQITLTAEPALGWRFVSWSGAVTGSELEKSLASRGDAAVTATFARNFYTLTTAAVDESGTAVPDAEVTLTPPDDPRGYVYQETVTATALAPTGWIFLRWEEALTGSSNPAAFDVTANATIRAVFQPDTVKAYTLITPIQGQGSVTRQPDQTVYNENQTVTLTAAADADWRFVRWTGDVGNIDAQSAQIIINMTSDKTLTAVFARDNGPTKEIYLPYVVQQ